MTDPDIFAKALSDPTRLRILMLLLQRQELCVCDLMSVMKLEQPKISRHLAMLRQSGIVLDRREGQWVHYRLHPGLPDWSRACLVALAEGARKVAIYESDATALSDRGLGSGTVCL